MKIGDKFKLKPSDGIVEIIAAYPDGQGGNKENQFVLLMDGEKIQLSEPMIASLFELYESPVPEEAAAEEAASIEVVESAPKKKGLF